MSRARLVLGLGLGLGVGLLVAGCGMAVVGDRCPGLTECDPQPAGDAGVPDGTPPDLTPSPDATPPPDSTPRPDGGIVESVDGDAGHPHHPWPVPDGAPAGDAAGAPDDGPPVATDGPCPSGELLCNGQCTAAFTDPDNCGACGHACQSGICLSGVCQDAAWGHLVLLGHDFTHAGVNEKRELANAVFLSLASPVRVAVYREYASAGSVARALAALTAEAAQRGRAVVTTLYADRPAFTAALGGVEAALLVAQDEASDDSLSGATLELQASLQSFVRAGGVLVVLDGPPAANDGTWQLVRSLAAVTGVSGATGAHVTVVEPTDAVALGLTASYAAAANSAAFAYTGSGAVARAAAGPVLIHEVVAP
jgi:hypothetical protein